MQKAMNKHNKAKTLILLHLLLMLYSASGIFSKLAANSSFLSIQFFLYYGCVIALLGAYALGWQQIIKRLPLTTAYANRAVDVVWGIAWGTFFFHETINIGKFLGAVFVIAGVILYAKAGDGVHE